MSGIHKPGNGSARGKRGGGGGGAYNFLVMASRGYAAGWNWFLRNHTLNMVSGVNFSKRLLHGQVKPPTCCNSLKENLGPR